MVRKGIMLHETRLLPAGMALGQATNGSIQGTISGFARQIQFALKLIF